MVSNHWLRFSRTWYEEEMHRNIAEVETQEVFNGATAKRKGNRIGVEEKLFACSQCSKKFKSVSNCKVHLKLVHKKLTQYTCNFKECLRKFGTKFNRDTHVANVHLSRPFKCKITGCTKGFGSKHCLDKHMACVHLARETFKCKASNCEKTFGSKQHLEFHQRSAGHGKEKLVCNHANCTALFSSSGNLSRHIRSVHQEEKPFRCPEQDCSKKFRSRQDIENHLRQAHGVPKLVCRQSNCNATSVSTHHYYAHMKKFH